MVGLTGHLRRTMTCPNASRVSFLGKCRPEKEQDEGRQNGKGVVLAAEAGVGGKASNSNFLSCIYTVMGTTQQVLQGVSNCGQTNLLVPCLQC